jgi:peptidoglycan/xylan/chitin deacetylase (PgdA/CDA1 family)
MQTPNDPNPFAIAGRFLASKYKEGARSQRDSDQMNLTQTTLAMHAAQHEATTRSTAQQARLTERSAKAGHGRTMHFAESVHGFAQPGTQVSIKYGDASASYTSKMPTPTAVSKPGRVPGKKVRGGKKVP